MKKYILMILLLAVVSVVIISMLPISSVLTFSRIGESGGIEYIKRYYSCFDFTVLGNANFGAFFSAIGACITSVLILIQLFMNKKRMEKGISICTIVFFICSLFPYIMNCVTVLTVIISLLWLIAIILSIVCRKTAN